MQNMISGSFFEELLQDVVQNVPAEKRSEVPLGIMMLEKDGTLSTIRVPIDEDNHDDVVSAMFAMDYVLYAFERIDWMSEFIADMNTLKDKMKEEITNSKRKKFTVLEGGKKD